MICFLERGGKVALRVVDNVQQKTLMPLFSHIVEKESIVYTDEYNAYHALTSAGYTHKKVFHGAGEYARDEDKDGFHEIHCNTVEGIWSLLRSWLRPYRGVSQEKLPFYIGFFEWLYNLRKKGKRVIHETLALLLTPDIRTYNDCLLSVHKAV